MAKRAEGASVKFDGMSFRLNDAERRIITKNAEKAGLSPSLYAKKQALEGKLKIMFSDAKAKEIITSLSRIGNNVNQIAKKINTEQVVDDSVKSQFAKIQGDLDIIMDFIILGKKPKKEKVETTSEQTEVKEASLFSSSPSVSAESDKEMELKEKKYCDYCGAELLLKENKFNQMVWICAKYYEILHNEELRKATPKDEQMKHTAKLKEES